MYFRHKPISSAPAIPRQAIFFLCLTLLIPLTSVQAVGFANLEEDFVSYSPIGSKLKAVFNDKEYIKQNSGQYNWELLRKFYTGRGYSPAWCRSDDHGYSVDLLLGYLETSFQEGLNPDDYKITPTVRSCHKLEDRNMARFDIALTNAFLKYSKDVHSGRLDPQSADEEWHITPVKFNPIATLNATLKNNNLKETIASLPPQHNEYKLLRTALKRYRKVIENRSWPQIPPGRVLALGTTHPHISLVRRRLADELKGGLNSNSRNGQFFDKRLKIAVESFQKRHGISMDGVIGPGTKRTMNVTAKVRINKILTSMERWRWMPRSLGAQYVLVNVPRFELDFIRGNRSVLNMRTIIGRKDRSSPSFQSTITQVVFNPTWTAPQSIAVKDLLPQQQKDPNFFASQNIEVMLRDNGNTKYNPDDIDWQQFDEENFPYMLRQTPGPHNSLGRIKFQSINKHGIFLHDTPYRPLFKNRVRAFSSGCIRLEKPEQLAATLLGNGYNPTPESANKVVELIENRQTVEHNLNKSVPVYLIYMTTWVDKNGAVQFRPDIYQRDNQIISGLNGAGSAG